MTILDEVKHIVAVQLEMNTNDLDVDENIFDLGADSLDIIEIVLAVEDEFDIYIPDEDCESIKTVSDIVKCVKRGVHK